MTPILPASPALPAAPASVLPVRVRAGAVQTVFDGPTNEQKAARASAVAARNAANNLLQGIGQQLAQINAQISVHDTNASGHAEWAREEADFTAIKDLADGAAAFLAKWVPAPAPAA